jgi:hypothetical protein
VRPDGVGECVAPPPAPARETEADRDTEALPVAEAVAFAVALDDLLGAEGLAVGTAALTVGWRVGVAGWQRVGERVGGRELVAVGEAVGVAVAPSGPLPEEAEGEPELLGVTVDRREPEVLRVLLAVALLEPLMEGLAKEDWDSCEAEAERVAEGEGESPALALGECEAETLKEGEREGVTEGVKDTVCEFSGLRDVDGEGLGERVGSSEAEMEGEVLSEGVEETEAQRVALDEREAREALPLSEKVAERELLGEGQGLGVRERLPVALAQRETLTVWLSESVAELLGLEGLVVAEGVKDGEPEFEEEPETVRERLPEEHTVAVRDCVCEPEWEAETE